MAAVFNYKRRIYFSSLINWFGKENAKNVLVNPKQYRTYLWDKSKENWILENISYFAISEVRNFLLNIIKVSGISFQVTLLIAAVRFSIIKYLFLYIYKPVELSLRWLATVWFPALGPMESSGCQELFSVEVWGDLVNNRRYKWNLLRNINDVSY